MSKGLGDWLSKESGKLATQLNEEFIANALTDEDVRTWHEDANATEHVNSLVAAYGPFQIWGSRQGAEPLTVKIL